MPQSKVVTNFMYRRTAKVKSPDSITRVIGKCLVIDTHAIAGGGTRSYFRCNAQEASANTYPDIVILRYIPWIKAT